MVLVMSTTMWTHDLRQRARAVFLLFAMRGARDESGRRRAGCVSGSRGSRGEGDTDSAGQSNAHVLLRFRSRTQAPDDQNPSRPRPIGPPSLCRAWRAIGPFAAVDLDRGSLQSTRPPLVAILIPRAHGRQQGRKAPPASAWVFCVAAAPSGTDPEALSTLRVDHAGRRLRQNVTANMLLDSPAAFLGSSPAAY
jgi:hypothetical protein